MENHQHYLAAIDVGAVAYLTGVRQRPQPCKKSPSACPPGAWPSDKLPPVPAEAQAMGIQADDIIVGLDHQELDMTMEQFLGHVRRNYLIGDRVTLNVICQGKRLELAVRLR